MGTLVLAAVAVIALAAAAALAGIAVARQDRHSAAGPPSQSPASQAWGERDICLAVLPLLSQGSTEIIAIYESPQRSTEEIDLLASKVRALEPKTPEKWQADVTAVREIYAAFVEAHGEPHKLRSIKVQTFQDSALRLTQGCRPYVLA